MIQSYLLPHEMIQMRVIGNRYQYVAPILKKASSHIALLNMQKWVSIAGAVVQVLLIVLFSITVPVIIVKASTVWCDWGSASPTIMSCDIAENTLSGVSYEASGHVSLGCNPSATSYVGGTLSNCNIYGNRWGVSLSTRRGHGSAGIASPRIIKNHIYGHILGGISISGSYWTSARIEDNVIGDNMGPGIYCTSTIRGPSISYNLISRNAEDGVYCTNPSAAIEYNYIVDNGGNGVNAGNLKSFHHNGIMSNSLFQCVFLGSADQIAVDNDWGTSDSNEIDGLIYDHFDDPILGTVQYVPILTVDDSKPTITSVNPVADDSEVDLDVVIQVTFSEDMRASTLNGDTVTLFEGDNKVPGKINYSEGVLEFDPDELLIGETVYILTLSSDIQEATYLKNSIDTFTTSFVGKKN